MAWHVEPRSALQAADPGSASAASHGQAVGKAGGSVSPMLNNDGALSTGWF